MKILVFDDNMLNLAAAEAQLKGHELTSVNTYEEARDLVTSQVYDVVLTDLLVLASGQNQGEKGKKFAGQEMPLGIFIALLAAQNGVKRVAVFTDSNHHDHPASACFDDFRDDRHHAITLSVGAGKVILVNDPNLVDHFEYNEFARPLKYEEYCERRSEVARAKNWGKLLEYLMSVT